jgi:hypothetical protein
MSVKVGYWTPLLHVPEIERSIRFCELLGFTTIDTGRCVPIGWARALRGWVRGDVPEGGTSGGFIRPGWDAVHVHA